MHRIRKALSEQQAESILTQLRMYQSVMDRSSGMLEREVRAILDAYAGDKLPNLTQTLWASAWRFYGLATENGSVTHYSAAYDLLAMSQGSPCPESFGQYYRQADKHGLTFA